VGDQCCDADRFFATSEITLHWGSTRQLQVPAYPEQVRNNLTKFGPETSLNGNRRNSSTNKHVVQCMCAHNDSWIINACIENVNAHHEYFVSLLIVTVSDFVTPDAIRSKLYSRLRELGTPPPLLNVGLQH
jgi:hypothetical protein